MGILVDRKEAYHLQVWSEQALFRTPVRFYARPRNLQDEWSSEQTWKSYTVQKHADVHLPLGKGWLNVVDSRKILFFKIPDHLHFWFYKWVFVTLYMYIRPNQRANNRNPLSLQLLAARFIKIFSWFILILYMFINLTS